MKFESKYIAGMFRVFLNKIFLLDHIIYKSIFQYIGRNCEFSVSGKSRLVLGKKNYFTRDAFLGAHTNGILTIGNNNYFNRGIFISCLNNIEIGDNNLFGPNVVIIDHDHRHDNPNELICKQGFNSKEVKIGSDCWICANVVITSGATIKNHIVIAANSVVVGQLMEPGTYAGAPARLVKRRETC